VEQSLAGIAAHQVLTRGEWRRQYHEVEGRHSKVGSVAFTVEFLVSELINYHSRKIVDPAADFAEVLECLLSRNAGISVPPVMLQVLRFSH
jgi:hypothetical protein